MFDLIGIGNVRLVLIYRLIVFLPRDFLRFQIRNIRQIHSVYHFINLIWLILSFGWILISLLFVFLSVCRFDQCHTSTLFYNSASFLYFLSSFIELLSEPLYLLSIFTKNESIHEFIQIFASIIGFGLRTYLISQNPDKCLIYFGFGYLIYSSIIAISYFGYFFLQTQSKRREIFLISSLFDLVFKPVFPFLNHKYLSSEMKEFLSEKLFRESHFYLFIIFSLVSDGQQGIFYFISIFSSLLSPAIEQISLNYFQRTFSLIKTTKITSKDERTMILNSLTLLNNFQNLFVKLFGLIMIFAFSFHYQTLNLYLIAVLCQEINLFNESYSTFL
ncbi:unnamed protein product [Adineta ricciae]|uniref:Protein RFT1 homolog n=1 Tax=Adineta ricciae TaxID=249248 RepID=A0A815DVW7_ADIRI|nr:unnamed protein product [Adineta ricciae]